ncbi:MAG: ArnT family glycosyltransferase [Acidobacteriota bacterium]
MSSIDFNSANREAVASRECFAIPAPRRGTSVLSLQQATVLTIAVMIVMGLGLRVIGLGSVGFAEDEIHKLEAVRAYDRGDFTSNAEHPMLMKALIDISMRAARVWNSISDRDISEEAALRLPNVLFGALTAIPLFLLTAALFDRRTALWAAALWSFGVNAITYNRIGKEDSLMVFFMLFAFYLFIRAKQIDGHEPKRPGRLRNLSAISFGLMLASKYFPHYLGLNMLYHHYYRMRQPTADEPRWVTPFSFFLIIGIAMVFANPVILLPKVWEYLNAYSGEKLLTHTGYLMGDHLYKNTMSRSPFWGTPVYFYLLFMAIKVPLTVLVASIVGFVVSLRRWRSPGPAFVLFMLLLWIVPYSLVGAKWSRYLLSLMPFLYMSAAIGAVALLRWMTSGLEKVRSGSFAPKFVTAALLLALVAMPAWTAYASAPHYSLYSNVLGSSYTAYFFPHDEFYDDGLNEAIRFVATRAPRQALIVTETPGVVSYYLEKSGRTDLQSRVLSDGQFTVSEAEPSFFILQRGRTYFENQTKMKEVRDRFRLVYAGCIQGHTAAEVYATQAGPNETVTPCGDARP